MFKIKLLILLLTSAFLFNCTKNSNITPPTKFSIAYIEGEYDGLLLKNLLTGYLNTLDMYDQASSYEIRSRIEHTSNLYITNIDNTSDRINIETIVSFKIINSDKECSVFSYTDNVSQFYIIASSDRFLSNQKAAKKIKKDNTEALVKSFINKLSGVNLDCDE